ncbi:hypothetical protein AX16_003342 [Volvariella volvacea WC 439]|nr:hypothetical protein AX16_003342 [Volvariella volvacea WC 439]
MLSAVAARKAAQAARQKLGQGDSSPKPLPHSSSPASPSQNAVTPKSKRKVARTSSRASPLTKRKKKSKQEESKLKRARYFDEKDGLEAQDEMVLMQSEEEVEDAVVLSSDSEDIQVPAPLIIKQGRSYSPSAPIHDSSEEEEDGINLPTNPPAPPPAATAPIVLSTFRAIEGQNVLTLSSDKIGSLLNTPVSRPGMLLALAEGESVTFLGNYSLAVLQGSISLLGTPVSHSDRLHDIFAVRSAPLPVLEWASSEGTSHVPKQLPTALRDFIQRPAAILLILELRSGIEGLGKVVKTFDPAFFVSPSPEFESIGLQMLTHQLKDTHPFVSPDSWTTALKSLTESSDAGIYLVKGAKRSGKSSFSRLLLNRLLTRYKRVAFLECDLGQSEFTPAGMVALNVISKHIFGPPFSHPSLPSFAHYIGSTSPKSSPAHYLAAIQALIESYRLDIRSPLLDDSPSSSDLITDVIPLVVNTMGWTKGLGADLSRQVEEIIEPTHIFEFDALPEPGWPAQYRTLWASSESNPYSTGPASKHFTLTPIPPSPLFTNYTPIDHRSISILSYFYALFPRSSSPQNFYEDRIACRWKTDVPLCARHPYEVDWSVAVDKFVLSGAGYEDVVSEEVHRVLNGAVVGLVEVSPGGLDDNYLVQANSGAEGNSENISGTNSLPKGLPYVQGALVPSPSLSQCRGLALIRSLDPGVDSRMHLLTPLPLRFLADARVVVKGELELPIWGMVDYRNGYSAPDTGGAATNGKENVPYLQWAKGEGVGSQRRRVRRNLMRRSQM